jgi:glutaredoxin 3
MAQIVIYKKTPCPYCDHAINFLKAKGAKFELIDLTGQDAEITKIKRDTGWMTFPIIMINGQLIGGYTDMKNLDAEGKLDSMLA